MTHLKTKFMGVEIKNPLIIGASNIVTDIENLKLAEKSGAAAIIYKSLFEEQIELEDFELGEKLNEYNNRHSESTKLFPDISHSGPEEYLLYLKRAVEAIKIPVFASLNAVNSDSWIEFAEQIEKTGVAGIELNFYHSPSDFQTSPLLIEDIQINIIKKVKSVVSIPVGVKISYFYSNILNFVERIDAAGADSITMFNRLFQPDIDVDTEKHIFPLNLSNKGDYNISLRYAGLLYGKINASICSATGIYSGKDVVKMILAGADSVQIVSTLYKNKISVITEILSEMEKWMEQKKYDSIESFRGKLSEKKVTDPFAYQRAQYVDIMMKSNVLNNQYKLV